MNILDKLLGLSSDTAGEIGVGAMRYMDQYCTYKERFTDGQHYYDFSGVCKITGKKVTVSVKGEELFQYNQGRHIQSALVSNTDAEREFLMSGISAEGWERTFNMEVGDDESVCTDS